MRVRTRTVSPLTDCGYHRTFQRIYTQGTFPPFKSESDTVLSSTVTEKSETISDIVYLGPEVVVNPVTGTWKRIKRSRSSIYDDLKTSSDGYGSRLFGKNRKFLPVKPCTHTATETRIKTPAPLLVQYLKVTGSGSLQYTDYVDYSIRTAPGLTKLLFGTTDVKTLITNSQHVYTAAEFGEPDWYELNSRFREKLEQFSDSNFLVGETMAENAIFVDAFKILVNPSNAIKVLLKHLGRNPTGSFLSKQQREKFRRMKLGEFNRNVKELGKKAVDFDLFYKFGVKPAIEDVKSALNAHHNVSSKMQYLRSHGGSYVPIRVRDVIVSPHTNAPPSPIYGTTNSTTCFVAMQSKEAKATIGAWGRVREDLNWSDDWNAYLQYFGINKVVGLAWELIPCSFVLDWFTDTQEILNNQTRLRTGSPFVSIKGTCASLKKVTKLELRLNPGYSPSEGMKMSFPSDQALIATHVTKSYSRFSSIPETAGVIDFSTLGLFQYATIAELTLKLWPH